MASTRNNNMRTDYNLQQYRFEKMRNYMITPENETTIKVQYPVFGVNYQNVPAIQLSNNSVDIESELYGIGSTNLIKPKDKVVSDMNYISDVVFVDRLKKVRTDFPTFKNERPMFK